MTDMQIIGWICLAFWAMATIFIFGSNPMSNPVMKFLWAVLWRTILAISIIGLLFMLTAPKKHR